MARKTINQLTEDTSPTSDDFLPTWDVASGAAKKTTLSNASKGMVAGYLPTNLLGYAEKTSSTTTTSTSWADASSLSITVSVPAGGKDVEITVFIPGIGNSGGFGQICNLAIVEGSTYHNTLSVVTAQNGRVPATLKAKISAPSPGSHTYKVQVAVSGATGTYEGGTPSSTPGTGKAFIMAKLV